MVRLVPLQSIGTPFTKEEKLFDYLTIKELNLISFFFFFSLQPRAVVESALGLAVEKIVKLRGQINKKPDVAVRWCPLLVGTDEFPTHLTPPKSNQMARARQSEIREWRSLWSLTELSCACSVPSATAP